MQGLTECTAILHLTTGLAFQLVTFSVFTVAAIVFYLRTLKHRDTVARPKRGWVWVLAALEFSSVMILTRSVFRIIEFANTTLGQRGSEEFVKKEWVIYVRPRLPFSTLPDPSCSSGHSFV
jgi:hypothetical protein